MSFAQPLALLGLLLLPVLALLNWRARGRVASAVRFSQLKALPSRRVAARPLVVGLLPWLRIAALFLLVLALARPQSQGAMEKETSEGIDIMLTMDISGTMTTDDMGDKTRFEVARETLEQFATKTENDRLGLVIFADGAFTQCPLTLDHEMVAELVKQVEMGAVNPGRTAVGMAIATAAHRLEQSKSRSRVIILMTDGQNNTGKIDPTNAAKAAAALGIKVYTVGVGTPGGVPVVINHPLFGRRYATNPDGTRKMEPGVDEKTLKEVAQITGGEYFRATDEDAMKRVYDGIRKLEKSQFELNKRRPVVEQFTRYVWPALMLLLLQFTLGATYARKAP